MQDFSFLMVVVDLVTADREDRLIVKSAVTAPDSSLSTIRHAIHTRVSAMTFHRRLIERNVACTDRYASCPSRLHTVKPDYNGAWFDKIGIMLTGDV
ncbi:hypothetical protein TNCV_807881 [Trichonephila clavipes]|nr:hypothetical protein TNCV_807881 [Trichonephila clavipes]